MINMSMREIDCSDKTSQLGFIGWSLPLFDRFHFSWITLNRPVRDYKPEELHLFTSECAFCLIRCKSCSANPFQNVPQMVQMILPGFAVDGDIVQQCCRVAFCPPQNNIDEFLRRGGCATWLTVCRKTYPMASRTL